MSEQESPAPGRIKLAPAKLGRHYSFLCFEQWARSEGGDCIRRGTARFRSCAEIIERRCLRMEDKKDLRAIKHRRLSRAEEKARFLANVALTSGHWWSCNYYIYILIKNEKRLKEDTFYINVYGNFIENSSNIYSAIWHNIVLSIAIQFLLS